MGKHNRQKVLAMITTILLCINVFVQGVPHTAASAAATEKNISIHTVDELLTNLASVDGTLGTQDKLILNLTSMFVNEYNSRGSTISAVVAPAAPYEIVVDAGGQRLTSAAAKNDFEITNERAERLAIQNVVLDGNQLGKGMILKKGKFTLENVQATGFQNYVVTLADGSAALDMNHSVFESGAGGVKGAGGNSAVIENCTFQSLTNNALIGIGKLTVNNTLFQDSTAGNGVAINAASNSVTTVTNSSFVNNTGRASGYQGGAISLEQVGSAANPCKLYVSNSYFKGNTAPPAGAVAGGSGGAIGIYRSYAQVDINQCVFEENKTSSVESTLSDGGAISMRAPTTEDKVYQVTYAITNSTFLNNMAVDDAAAILIEGNTKYNHTRNTTGKIENCTFVGNTAKSVGLGRGGAIQVFSMATANITNSTFYKNSNLGNGGGAIGYGMGGTLANGLFYVGNCLFVDNTSLSSSPNYQNVFASSATAANKKGNIGFDCGTAFNAANPQPDASIVFGTPEPVLAENGAMIYVGCGSAATTLKTLLIGPNLGIPNTAYADKAGIAANANAQDQRGQARNTTAPDAGAVEINATIFYANGGNWASPTFNYNDSERIVYNSTTAATVCGIADEHATINMNAIPVPDTAPDGKEFKGWNTIADGTGTSYGTHEIGDTGMAYYAIWGAPTPVTYTVTYDVNGGDTGAAYVQENLPAGSYTVLANSDSSLGFAKSGYTFLGWSETASDTAAAYAGGEAFILAGNVTLYAIYREIPVPVTYTVTYDVNGGDTGAAYVQENLPAGSYTVLANSDSRLGFAKSGYTFLGWSETASDTAAAYAGGEAFILAGNVTLYAIYREIPVPVTYTVTYDVNGGDTGAAYVQENLPAGSYTVLANSDNSLGFARTGFVFAGWNTDKTATTGQYHGEETIALSGDITLYAIWTEDSIAHQHYSYVVGYPDGTIRPSCFVSREEVATILVRVLEENVLKSNWRTTNTFPDVADKKWSNNTISTMEGMGYITGYPGGKYKPESKISREEFATIIVRMAGLENVAASKNYFADVPAGSWSAKFINIAYENNLAYGRTAAKFEPRALITRAEAMAMVNRMLGRRVLSKEDLLPDMLTFPDNTNTGSWYYLDVQEATNSHFCVEGPVADGIQYEKWTKRSGTPNWLLLTKQGDYINDLVYPKS